MILMCDLFVYMNPEDPEEIVFPSPHELANEVAEMPQKVPLRHYYRALCGMRSKGYSYAEIAKWISEKLGMEISRNKVAYLINIPSEALDAMEEQDEMEALADEAEEQA